MLEFLILTTFMFMFQFSYESPFYNGVNPNCCKLLPISCWRHCLKTIEIEDFGELGDEEALDKYFLENAEILKSFQYFKEFVLLKRGQDPISL
jgi:hypothetical protein